MGPPRAKTNSSANTDFQPTLNKREAPPTRAQNLASTICKLEKVFADEVTTYTSITAGIHSQYFFLYDKVRQLEPGNAEIIIWNVPSVKFVYDSQKWLDHHQIPSLNRPQVSVVISSGLILMDTTSSSNFTLMVLGPLLASVLQYYSSFSSATTTFFSNGPFQIPSKLVFKINWTH